MTDGFFYFISCPLLLKSSGIKLTASQGLGANDIMHNNLITMMIMFLSEMGLQRFGMKHFMCYFAVSLSQCLLSV